MNRDQNFRVRQPHAPRRDSGMRVCGDVIGVILNLAGLDSRSRNQNACLIQDHISGQVYNTVTRATARLWLAWSLGLTQTGLHLPDQAGHPLSAARPCGSCGESLQRQPTGSWIPVMS